MKCIVKLQDILFKMSAVQRDTIDKHADAVYEIVNAYRKDVATKCIIASDVGVVVDREIMINYIDVWKMSPFINARKERLDHLRKVLSVT